MYLSANLPASGKSLIDYSQDSESVLGPNIALDQARGIGTITLQTMRAAFFNTTPAERATAALGRLRPEPLQPFVTPVTTTTAKFGSLPRYYIATLRDRAIGPTMQKTMYEAQPIEHVYTLEADHSSYFSQTQKLAEALLDIAQTFAQLTPTNNELATR